MSEFADGLLETLAEFGPDLIGAIVFRPFKTADYWGVHPDVMERVKLGFDAAGIEIPLPQRDVHVKNTAA